MGNWVSLVHDYCYTQSWWVSLFHVIPTWWGHSACSVWRNARLSWSGAPLGSLRDSPKLDGQTLYSMVCIYIYMYIYIYIHMYSLHFPKQNQCAVIRAVIPNKMVNLWWNLNGSRFYMFHVGSMDLLPHRGAPSGVIHRKIIHENRWSLIATFDDRTVNTLWWCQNSYGTWP